MWITIAAPTPETNFESPDTKIVRFTVFKVLHADNQICREANPKQNLVLDISH